MLVQRVITAAIGIPIIIGLTLLDGLPYAIVAAAIVAIAALEYYAATDPTRSGLGPRATEGSDPRATEPGTPRATEPSNQATEEVDPAAPGTATPTAPGPAALVRQPLPALMGAAAAGALAIAAREGFDELAGVLVIGIAVPFVPLVLRGEPEVGLRDFMWVVPGIAYVGFLGAHLVLLRELDDDGEWVFLVIFGTWATDTFSYFAGRAFGRHHPVPRISPGKTVEGYLAGYVGGFASIVVLDMIFGLTMSTLEAAVLGLLFPGAAMIGDLAESLIKRGSHIKDTSELVPGHGGFLDRLDSILFTAPLVYYFVIWAVY